MGLLMLSGGTVPLDQPGLFSRETAGEAFFLGKAFMADARISTSLPSHPKTKKLMRRLGGACGGWYLVRLFLWVAENRSNGDLSGMTDEDIELAVDFDGDEGTLISALCDVGFMDGEQGERVIHDWEEHNPWAAGADARSVKAKWNAMKRHHGEQAADKAYPEYAAIRPKRDNDQHASSTNAAQKQDSTSNAPSPYPSPLPSPSPSPNPSPLPIPEDSADKSAKSRGTVLRTYLDTCKAEGVKPIPDDHYSRSYADDAGITRDMLAMCWFSFVEDHTLGGRKAKKYKDWAQAFGNAVKANWYKFWFVDNDGLVQWTSQGKLYKTAHDAKQAKVKND